MANDKIVIRGALEHNLKNINRTRPREKLIVMTGVSGAGKSSLAFDTIYADGPGAWHRAQNHRQGHPGFH